MKKLLLTMALLIGINVTTFGYATIYHSIFQRGHDVITFNSSQKDIIIELDNQVIGNLSNVFEYKVTRDGSPKTFVFKKDGYKTKSIEVGTKYSVGFWFNGLAGFSSTIGSSVDSWLTKNAYEYSPNQFYIELTKI